MVPKANGIHRYFLNKYAALGLLARYIKHPYTKTTNTKTSSSTSRRLGVHFNWFCQPRVLASGEIPSWLIAKPGLPTYLLLNK